MKEKIGFSIIGCGGIANFHAKAVLGIEKAQLLGVYDYSFEFAQKFAEKYNCKAFRTVEELLSNEQTDVVNICTPSGLHAEYAISAAKAAFIFMSVSWFFSFALDAPKKSAIACRLPARSKPPCP